MSDVRCNIKWIRIINKKVAKIRTPHVILDNKPVLDRIENDQNVKKCTTMRTDNSEN